MIIITYWACRVHMWSLLSAVCWISQKIFSTSGAQLSSSLKEGSTLSVCLSVCLPNRHTHITLAPTSAHHPPPNWTLIMSCEKKGCVPLKGSLNQTQLIPLFSLIVLCKERVPPIRLLTPAVALSDLLGCRNEIMDCTITQLVVRDSAVRNEHSNCGAEVS